MKRSISSNMSHLVDLSHELHEQIPVYPGTPAPVFDPITSIDKDGFTEYYMHLTNHSGTHMDFPAHVLKDGKTITDFPVDHFAGRGSLVDCRGVSQITRDMVKAHIDTGTEVIVLYTGWDKQWSQPAYFDNFPVLTAEAASFIANLKPKAIGCDMISFDAVGDADLPNHKILLKQDVLLIENLTNLENLVGHPFDLFFLPLPFRKADASPVRAVAHLHGSME